MSEKPNSVVRRLTSSVGKLTSFVLPYEKPKLREHYLIEKKLGQGQFGMTYLCTKKETGMLYACKLIPKMKLIYKEDYEDVWREIQIMHHLSEHPNVVRIKATYEDIKIGEMGSGKFN